MLKVVIIQLKGKKYCPNENGKERVDIPLFWFQTRLSPHSSYFVHAKVDVMDPNQF